jgi:hypothetical protein
MSVVTSPDATSLTHLSEERRRPALGRPRFHSEALSVLGHLQGALSEVISLIPQPVPVEKAADLERALKLGKTLAWQVFRMARAPNPLVEGAKLPGPFAMQRFFQAALKAGVPQSKIDVAASAFSEFGRLIKTHAGDRVTFESLMSGLSSRGGDQVELTQRRTAFRANSHIWGVQAETQLSFAAIHPSARNPSLGDMLVLRGLIGLRRLRADVPVVIARSQISDNKGTLLQFEREPIDPTAPTVNGQTVLRDFCSSQMPRLQSLAANGGCITIELQDDAVGNQSKLTCITGDVLRAAQRRYGEPDNSSDTIRAIVQIPCEVLIHDLLIHEDMYDRPIQPEVGVYTNMLGRLGVAGRDIDRLPVRVSLERLGQGSSVLECLEVPRYVEMADHAFERLGWSGDGFTVYRCRMDCPVMQSFVDIRFELPERNSEMVGRTPASDVGHGHVEQS